MPISPVKFLPGAPYCGKRFLCRPCPPRANGDAQACGTELVRHWAGHSRGDPRPSDGPLAAALFDSMDVVSRSLASFFTRIALGQFELDSPKQLIRLLQTMAGNGLINHVRKHHAAIRDCRRQVQDPSDVERFVDPHPGRTRSWPTRTCCERSESVSPRRNAASWSNATWDAPGKRSARRLHDSRALRIRLRRALDRVLAELGLEA